MAGQVTFQKSAMKAGEAMEGQEPAIDPYERRVLMGELNTWGRWIENHWEYEGYPSLNILASYIGGSGGGQPGHRILCLEMPTGIYATHQRVIRLPDHEKEAVYIKHVTVMREDGSIRSIEERCLVAQISEVAFRKRLSRAYQRIMGIIPL